MSDNNNNNSSCSFSEQLISYLYNEIDARVKTEFEAHLRKCRNCADELAGFGIVRSAVFDWQKEFSAMETPEFVFETERKKVLSAPVSISAARQPLFSQIRALFSLYPMRASTVSAMAILAICAGVFLIAVNFSHKDEVAQNNSVSVQQIDDSPSINRKTDDKIEVADKITNESSPEKTSVYKELKAKNYQRANASAVATSAANAPVIKVSNLSRGKAITNKTAPDTNNFVAVNDGQKLNGANKTDAVSQTKKLPKFVDVEEDDDNSLRLADLFDEGESN